MMHAEKDAAGCMILLATTLGAAAVLTLMTDGDVAITSLSKSNHIPASKSGKYFVIHVPCCPNLNTCTMTCCLLSMSTVT